MEDGRAVGVLFQVVLLLLALPTTICHFSELADTPSDTRGRTAAILGEILNVVGYMSTISYAAAVNDEEPISKGIEVGFLALSNIAYAGLQTAEAAHYEASMKILEIASWISFF